MNPLLLDWLVSNLRWFWLILTALFVLGEGLFTAAPSPYFLILLLIVGVGLVLNGIYAGFLWANYYPNWMAVVAIVLDVVIAIAILVLMREHAFLLLPVAVFPIIIAGVRWDTEAGLLTALPIVLSYGVTLVPILGGGEIDRPELIETLFSIGMVALVLFAAGAVPGLFMRRRVERLEHANEAELERLRVANERGRLISEMALTMSSTLNYRNVLRTMIDLAFSAMVEAGIEDETTVGMVLLFEGDGGDGRANQLTVVAGHNLARRDEGRKVSGEEGLIGRTIHTAEVKITHRAQHDKGLVSFASTPGIRSAICAPLRAGFTTYGVVLFCTTEPNFYNEDHASLLATFCSQAIIALQNAQLFEDLQLEQQRILEKEAEARRKLARDLHDGPTQSIAAIAMRLNFIKMVLQNKDVNKAYDEIIKVEEIAQRTTHEIRTMLFAMRPVILETQGLMAALEQYVERLRTTETFEVVLSSQGYDGQLDSEAEGVVFAIVEEAVGNVKKHSQATKLNISLVARQGNLFVEVRDNGVGFDVDTTKATYDQRTSLGLINMDERARAVGGRCVLESTPGKGATVRLQIPFERSAPRDS
ncbi:MAG: GAF domain-containing sensor histidine kinase [Anaerolineae bacterium]|nr:GAF domain-containing sensor histidine kinase [Anaerolineae bacterium]